MLIGAMSLGIDTDAVVAVADLVARSGGREFEFGYLDENVPVEKARWYAQARFKGALLVADERKSPDEACDALARRLLTGGQCTGCGKRVSIGTSNPKGHCGWHRDGPAWVRGCDGKRQATRDGVTK